MFTSVHDIEQTVIKTQNGTALRVRDIATVTQGPKIRLGQIGKAIHREDGKIVDDDDVVEGIVLLRKGANSDATLDGIHEKVKELNDHILPPGVKIVPFLDRSDLVHFTTHTVLHNLTEGILLVSIILFLFLGNVRGALIVALTIPFALLFASICLDLANIPANLLSLGALDFGMVVDGAVVMIENIVRHLNRRAHNPSRRWTSIRDAAHEVQRPVFYAIGIIITAYLPIFTLAARRRPLFKPMAWTVAFALLGALIFSMLIAPVLCQHRFSQRRTGMAQPRHDLSDRSLSQGRPLGHRAPLGAPSASALAGLALAGFLMFSGVIGSEFLPHLDEGAIWVRGTLAPSTGPTEGVRIANQARVILASFPEVTMVTSQVGRPDDGTDTTGFFNTEYFVDLKPKEQWRPVFHEDKDALIAAMDRELDKIPGVIWNFSQPIADNMEEAVSGVKGELAVKIYGDDLKILEETGDQIVNVMRSVPASQDLGLFRVIGQPNLNFTVDRKQAARYGINVADVQDAIQTAVGGKAVSQVLQGRAALRPRRPLPAPLSRHQGSHRKYPPARPLRRTRLARPTLRRARCSTALRKSTARQNSRYVAIKYSVRGRDLGSTVEEAMKKGQSDR